MSITSYTGLPGHGKSYGVVANVIAPALQTKRRVLTNIPMNDEECMKRFGMTVTPININDLKDDDWWRDSELAGAVVVLDEVWRVWPAGLKANNVPEAQKSFLAEHRHLVGENGFSTEIVLVTQDLGQIASFARVLVETTFRVTKLSRLGADKMYRVDVYSGPVTGPFPPVSKREREIPGKFKQEVYTLYKSHTKSEVGAGNETRTDKRFNAFGRLSIKLGFAFVIVCIVILWFGSKKVLSSYTGNPEVVQSDPVQQSVEPVAPQSQPVPPAPEPKFKFLSNADLLVIVWNNGHWPNIDYRYKVVFNDYEAVMTTDELARMEYRVQPINDCVVRISGPDFDGFALCPKHKPERGFFEELVSPTTDETG